MAKTAVTATVETSAAPTLSTKVQRMIDDIRGQFGSFARDFRALTESRALLAPKFMRTADAWMAETGGTFVGFVRVLDPHVPADRDGYRAHPVYQAADYLRRIQARAEETPGGIVDNVDTGERPATPLMATAALVATLQQLVPDVDLTPLWRAFEKQLHWSEQQVARLQSLVEEQHSLLRRASGGRLRAV